MIKIILLILIFNSSCDDPAINGCTSPSACNFNPEATKSDGTCIQPEGCNDWCLHDEEAPKTDTGDCLGQCTCNENGENCLNIIDDCGVCRENGENHEDWNTTCLDCENTPNGTLSIDCNGECGGTAIIDDCGVCAGGSTVNDPNYLKDCNGDCLGNALVDDCGVCTEGNTGFAANFLKDECGICNGDGYRENCLNGSCEQMDCSGVCNKDAEYSVDNECENECENCGWKPNENCNDCASYGECALYGSALDTCDICSDGISNHQADSDKDCNGICFGPSSEDCYGICGGNAQLDECNVCDGQGAIYECGCTSIEEGKCDCDGNIDDECGVCGGSGPDEGQDCDGICVAEGDNLDENGYDCANECGGNSQLDDCNICNGDGYTAICLGTENCTNMDCTGTCTGQPGFGIGLDCAGQCGGSASYGCDGICCGGITGIVCAEYDNCGDECATDPLADCSEYCDNDSSNDCVQDCNDEWGGTASIDNCGTCAGGTTSVEPNQGTTSDGLYSCSDITLLVEAGVCSDSDNCSTNTCPSLSWDGINLDGFNFAACGISSVPNYVLDFNVSFLNLSYNNFVAFPENIVNMTSLTSINLSNNFIEEVPNSACTLTANNCTIDLTENFLLDCDEVPDCNINTDNCD